MLKRVAVAILAALLVAAPALAEPAVFTWTGYGLNVPGSGKCPTYKMTIDVTVVGTDVQGRFQQEGRPERNFKATLGADMKFKTTAVVGGGNKMDVVGSPQGGRLDDHARRLLPFRGQAHDEVVGRVVASRPMTLAPTGRAVLSVAWSRERRTADRL